MIPKWFNACGTCLWHMLVAQVATSAVALTYSTVFDSDNQTNGLSLICPTYLLRLSRPGAFLGLSWESWPFFSIVNKSNPFQRNFWSKFYS